MQIKHVEQNWENGKVSVEMLLNQICMIELWHIAYCKSINMVMSIFYNCASHEELQCAKIENYFVHAI